MSVSSTQAPPRPQERRLSDSAVRRLFAELQGLYGSRWIDMWKLGQVRESDGADLGLLNAQDVWAKALGGFADHLDILRQALQACHSRPFPPTLPEFLESCRSFCHGPLVPKERHLTVVRNTQEPDPAETAARAQEALERARSVTVKGPSYDYKGWAKKIVANPKNYPAMSLKLAREALGAADEALA